MASTAVARPAARIDWFACYTRARHEKKVDQRLRGLGLEVFLPTIARVRQWNDREKVVEWPLFPGYVFARFGATHLHRVLGTPGVATVVSFNGQPLAIPETEVENVRKLAVGLGEAGMEPEPVPMLRTGQAVRIVDGPLEGVEGIVAERRARDRVLLTVGLDAIGQGMRVELDATALEPLEDAAA
ncbi:MAG TPA: UpxY family transcription antiterminator [Gemmatimonadota bacterium]|nr:UpxY family transcription antiterminator [Gemmatimonadota bacterium]